MSRYQKQTGNATCYSKQSRYWVWLLFFCGIWGTLGVYSHQLSAAPLGSQAFQRQISNARFVPLLITPLAATSAQLQMHTADFQVDESDGRLTVAVDAQYRLKNPQISEAVTVALRIAPMTTAAAALIPIEGLTLLADGQPLALSPGDGGIYTAQVQIGADARTDLRLSYWVDLQSQRLPLIEYVVVGLQRWSGAPSLRITMTTPTTIPQASWLRIGPAGWHFGAENADRLGAKWFYDGQQPDAPFALQFVQPNLWAQISQLTLQVQMSTNVADFLQLGDLYQQLVMAAAAESAPGVIRERFYAQALATYTTGIERLATTATPSELATLYAGLATLYRTQIAEGGESIYALPLAAATQAALDRLPADDLRRQELTQWLADGLQILLAEAQQRQDWQSALQLSDQLAALPANVVDSISLAKTKRLLLVQQALQLLAEDNRPAAVALAGDDLRDSTLSAPASADSLFSRWEITLTITPQQQQLLVVGKPVAERVADATAAFATLVESWQAFSDYSVTVIPSVAEMPGNPPNSELSLQLSVTAPPSARWSELANPLPPRADWALLRALLQQLQPTIQEETAWFNRRWTIAQVINLQSAGEQWQAMATTLERQATQFEQESAGFNTADPIGAENALRARIQAANYRSAAHAWERLNNDSWVTVQLTGPAGSQARTWLLTATTPAQPVSLTVQPSAAFGVLSMIILVVVALFVLTSVLWWLL
ncbi:MAG: hypothetical protein KF832_22070 [Caldilineaceae bacterium]|nr:hypothetical protein [Caldilineaceae bacterium]